MAFDLVSAYYASSDAPFYQVGGAAQTLTEAPQQFTLRFSPGVKIDPSTLGSISIVRSGEAGDAFGNGNDVTIVPGSVTVNDLPNQNEVVIRFKETLPDDSYRITVGGGAGGLKTVPGDTLAATSRSFDVRLDLGAFVVSVVPQPVSRTGGALGQNRDQIAVYFNANDPLNADSARTPGSYRLFEIDPATGSEVAPLAPQNPASVTYDSASGKAVLTFASGTIADDKLYRLQIGATETLVSAAAPVTETAGLDHSSFAAAQDLGALSGAGATVNGAITQAGKIPTPLSGVIGPGDVPTSDLLYPSQPGSLDEPGHRNVPTEIGNNNGLPSQTVGPASSIPVYSYNFQDVYGQDPQGNSLHNAITETQKQRAREIFDLISQYHGVRFIETGSSGITVVTGDVRAISTTTPPDAVGGMGGGAGGVGSAIMSSLQDWGASEYGGAWFQVAMHEIGHALELMHSWELPSIMGAGLTGEPVFPGDYDKVQFAQHYPATGSDVDVYKFTLAAAGKLSAETVVARPGTAVTSALDSLLTLYREDTVGGRTVRTLVARNDDSYGRDSFIGLDLSAGTYYIAVSSTGNDAFNPEIADSGYGGRTDGAYQLKLGFQPASTSSTTIVDASGTQLDGDRDGKVGGAFNFWFNTASTVKTVFVDKAASSAGADGSLAKPYSTISAALAAVNTANNATPGGKTLVRIVGNTAGVGATPLPYLVGTDLAGRALPDGATFNVPAGVTVMIDEGAVFKLRAANIDVGSSSELVSRAGASLQVLGTPNNNVKFTSYHDDSIGGNSDGVGPAATGGQWGGIVFRADSDSATKKAFVDSISQAAITYGGGQVYVDSQLDSFSPIQLENTRPTLAFNTITNSAGAGISATPDSFEDSNGRIGPEIRGNTLLGNSTNGLFVKIRTPLGGEPERLDVPARFRSTDIVYVLQDNLFIAGGAGGYLDDGTNTIARKTGRLTIDPGVVVKLQGARIELERGESQLIAEGTSSQRVVFTSLGDNRFGAGGTFDTNGNLPDVRTAGDWGGIVLDAGSRASIDYAYLAYGGGQTPIEGTLDAFNVIETHQGDLRLAHSRIENNAAGTASTNRTGRGGNAAATIFVRGAQPVILSNDFRDNLGAVISINANSLSDIERPDPGRSTGAIARDARYDDNRGPLIRDNRLSYTIDAAAGRPSGGAIEGMQVRGEEITTETVWDDTDIVHVSQSEILVSNFQTATGLRLVSQPGSSLVVKLSGANAGFTATGYGTDIPDRIGGTVQVVGQPGYPVILTSLKDDSVGASLDPLGQLQKDTNADGAASTPVAGDWRSLKFLPFSNDTNVAIVQESERAASGWTESNATPGTAQVLGVLAPNGKSGDDNRRLGFEVHGAISWTSPGDVDVYSFTGYAGSEVWIDLDKTSSGLDSMVELLDASGKVLARSADSQTDLVLSAGTRGIGQDLQKDSWQGGDFYSVNPKDAGMRVILPGATVGAQNQYFIRVRSQPRYDNTTTQAAYEADLADATKVAAGATSGAYELRLRLQQRDEKPGSTVRYADIRCPQVGIDVLGLPQRSLLTGETGETTATNDVLANAQFVGNVLQSDQATISVAGAISSATDVDWYQFTLNYEQLESITGVNAGTKSWSTVFDIDYGDGFRGDLTLSVFDSTGNLIYVGRDSNVASDQGGTTFTDPSSGSAGKLDPFIGSVQLPAGGPTGSGGLEAGGVATPADPTKQLKYYVAVSSNEQLPAALDATFKSSATNSLIRLEPVNSITRVVEDHIGSTGYKSNNDPLGNAVTVSPTTPAIIDPSTAITLSAHVTPFTLSDVTLFVSTAGSLLTVDAMRGGVETTVSAGFGANDIVMRSDGTLYGYRGLPGVANTAGTLDLINSGTGARTNIGNDSIPNSPGTTTVTETNLPAKQAGAVAATTFTVANRNVQPATMTGTLQYTGAVSGNTVTGTWTFTVAADGTLTFNPVSEPAGLAKPSSGTMVGSTGVLSITWSSQVAASGVTLASTTYTYDPDPNAVTTDNVDAMAWNFTTVGAGTSVLYYSVREGADKSRLYRADPKTGSAAVVTGQPWGRIGGTNGYIQTAGNDLGITTGMAFLKGTLYGVDTKGNLFTINTSTGAATLVKAVTGSPTFGGLTLGPQNLQAGMFADTLFAIDASGYLYCLDTSGNLQTVFDAQDASGNPGADGVADSTTIPTGLAATGLAFSPLDINLWHPTVRRGDAANDPVTDPDPGHGINAAPDNSRKTAGGGQSMYFGLEKYVSSNPAYTVYAGQGGQYGALSSAWQEDLSSDSSIANTYNLPGGAYGSLTTNPFDLSTYSYADKPTLYFNYWLQTQGASGKTDTMRDSARVFVSIDGGATWEVLATNNSSLSSADTTNAELPAFPSTSARISTNANQQVQQLYNSGSWRQARVDLGNYAGNSDIRLRFDFSTAGEFDKDQMRAYATTVSADVTDQADVVVADITGILPGMQVVAAGVTGTTVLSVDAATNTVTLDQPVTLNADAAISFSGLVNNIAGLAGTTGNFGSAERGQDNKYEGFYIDDIIVGFAERGEMVTGATAGQTGFFGVGTPLVGSTTVPAQALTGPYQLEIRHGTTYATMTDPVKSSISINIPPYDTNDDLVAANTAFGDANTPRQQGQFLIQNNLISAAASYGISIDAGVRDPNSKAPIPGTPRNLPVLNSSRLVPGVVVVNNVVSTSGTAGILFSGDPNTGTVPTAAVPYGRIVNNTIYGGSTPKGTGIVVSENAGPTLMNNLFVNLATGVSVDASSRFDTSSNQRTVITTSAFYAVGTQVNGATQSQPLTLSGDPFVNAAGGNFYLRAGSAAIDSSLNSLADRNEFVVVNVPLGVPQSPTIAPDRDIFGQLRGDDPSQASAPGLGSNVFKDRGAIDRVDFTKPLLSLLTPADNGPADADPAADVVLLQKADARGVTQFSFQITDSGAGIDKTTVTKAAFTLTRDGIPLTEGSDYVFRYLETNNIVVFESASVFTPGVYAVSVNQILSNNSITDLAGNSLLGNKTDGTTSFTIQLADVPTAPTNLTAISGDAQITLNWIAATSQGTPLLNYEIQQSLDAAFTAPTSISPNPSSTDLSRIVATLTNGTSYWFRIRAVNSVGASDWSAAAGPVVPLPIPSFSLASDTGASSSDGITSNGLVNVSGVISGATWEFSTDSGASWTAGTGSTFTLPANATYPAGTIRVRQISSGSRSSAFLNAAAITIDTIAPAVAAIAAVTDDAPLITGPVADGGTTNDAVLVLSGTTESGTSVEVFNGSTSLGFATVTGTTWTFTTATLSDGTTYVFKTRATDLAGNVGGYSATHTVTIDTTAPAAPTITAVTDDVAPVVGNVADNGSTNDTMLVLSGTTDAGTTVEIYNGVAKLGDATVTGTTWTFTTATLTNGTTLVLTARAADTAGNTASSASRTVTIDTTPPPAPAITGAIDDQPLFTGNVPSGGRTNDTVLVLTGTTETGSTVEIFSEATKLGDATVTGTNWTFTTATLTNGTTYSFTAKATDAAGNAGPASAAYAVTIDTTPPASAVISSVTDDVPLSTGPVPNGGTSNDPVLVLAGTTDAGSTVEIYDGATKLGNATVTGTSWAFTTPTLVDGTTYVFKAVAIDQAGNVGADSATHTVTIDTTPPAVPVITAVMDDVPLFTGAVPNGGTTNDPVLVLSGTTDAGTTVEIFSGATKLGNATVTGTSWTFTTASLVNATTYVFTAKATDAAGNTTSSATHTVTIDTTPPVAPTIASVTDDAVPITGNVPSGGITNDTTLLLKGTTAAGTTVEIFSGAIKLGDATVVGTLWAFTTAPLADGAYTLTAKATDAAGNVGPASAAYAVTVDTIAPAAAVISSVTDDVPLYTGPVANGGVTNDTVLVLSGTTDAGTTVEIYNGAAKLGNATVTGTSWTFTTATLTNGTTYAFKAVASDQAGNVAPDSTTHTVTIDTTPPPAPAITGAIDDQPLFTGNVPNGGLTNDATLTLIGTTAAGTTVEIFNGATKLGDATVTGTNWTFTTAPLAGVASYSFVAKSADAAGNVGPASAAYAVTVDTTPPVAPTITAVTDDVAPVVGNVANGGTTNDTVLVLSGTTETGTSVEVFDGATKLGDATVTGTTWTFTTATLSDGTTYVFKTRATDAAGNVGADSAPYAVTIDTVPPATPTITAVTDDVAPIVGNVANGGTTNDTVLFLSGTTDAGTNVAIYNGATKLGNATVTGTSWTFTTATLVNGTTYVFKAAATDQAGNVGADSATHTVTIKTTPPAAPVIATVTDDVAPVTGNVPNGGVTNDTVLVLAGTTETGSTVEVYRGATKLGDATVTGTNWTFTTATLTNGTTYSFTAKATDAAGNVGPVSAAYSVTVDTIAPAAPSITGIGDNVAPVIGNVANGGTTNDATPTLTGTAEAGAVITVRRNGTTIGTATANGSGLWTLTTPSLADGTSTFTATATDAAGNTSGSSADYVVTIDTVAPLAPTIVSVVDDRPNIVGVVARGGTTNDNELLVVGTAEPGVTVSVRSGGSLVGSATADGSGNWSLTTVRLVDGTYSFTATAADAADNVSPTSSPAYAVTVDTVAPARAAITSVVDDVGAITGNVPFGGRTDDTTLLVSGTAEPGSLVVLRSDTAILRRFYADAFGNWSVTTPVLAVQAHKLNAYARDAAGNVGMRSPNHTITVDTTAPTILSFGTTAAAGTYAAGSEIPIYATASELLLAGSAVDVTLNTGAVVRLATAAAGSRLTGTYRVLMGSLASPLAIVAVANVSPVASDLAGNPVSSLPTVPFVFSGLNVDAAIRAFATGFASDPSLAPSVNAPVTSVQIVFSTEVTGVSLANIRLIYGDRDSISLRGATITGSGRNYTLTLPSSLTNRLGAYRLSIGPSSTIRSVDGNAPMDLESNAYWQRV